MQLFRKANQWQLCTHKVTFTDNGEERVQYTGDVQWFKEFEEKWDFMTINSIEEVTFSDDEKARYERIKDMPEDFGNVYSHYVLTGELLEENTLPKSHPFLVLILEDTKEVLKAKVAVLENKTKSHDQRYKDTDINSVTLDELKELKMNQLKELCQLDIYNGFEAKVGDKTYFFSFDAEAQANFTGAVTTLTTGLITSVPEWTVKLDGVYVRINMTLDQFKEVALTGFYIKDQKIARLRNNLEIKVKSAKTATEVDSINW